MEKRYTPNLWLCVFLDLVGCASYAIPVLGEVSDVVWAPIAAFIFYRMFGGTLGSFGSIFTFIEELFPGTDIIPSFTLAWVIRRVFAPQPKGAVSR
ncbi:hypothetical protein CLV59_102142 [Chitinophaga dinghuensis]|uniref:Uncharacterized protein n=1 Tax=Chitinophaga dinghuensis TaxID=1539050 RepID=A0A327W4J3_9BACT|nr:hypothetical protein [Chitinophaga dinghuensis]RAJ85439.1 hypothetical protein CLV59_102142 [Chitinophaga dinghuensis]